MIMYLYSLETQRRNSKYKQKPIKLKTFYQEHINKNIILLCLPLWLASFSVRPNLVEVVLLFCSLLFPYLYLSYAHAPSNNGLASWPESMLLLSFYGIRTYLEEGVGRYIASAFACNQQWLTVHFEVKLPILLVIAVCHCLSDRCPPLRSTMLSLGDLCPQ